MSTFRTDANHPCGCPVKYADSPSGPKIQPCTCKANEDAAPEGTLLAAAERAQYPHGRGPTLDEATKRAAERAKAAEHGGVPAGAETKRDVPK